MAKCCFSFAATRNSCFRLSFSISGLKSATADLGHGTVMHCWVPKRFNPTTKPNLVLIHGVGANAMWQFNEFISPLTSHFNVFVPDLLFFGDSFTTRSDRSEKFQAQCVAELLASFGVKKASFVGMSYGGFVAYSIAAQFPDLVEKLVLCCAGVAMEEKDMDEGMFKVKSVDEATAKLFPQTPDQARDLLGMTFHKPVKRVPTWLLRDFIDVMCTDRIEEKKELIHALHKDRKLSDLPKISKAPFMIWGEYDQVFPIELAHRLKKHLNDNATLVVIKDAGHAINAEKSKEMFKHLKAFLLDPTSPSEVRLESNGRKID